MDGPRSELLTSDVTDRFQAAISRGVVRPIFWPDGTRFCFIDGIPDRTVIWDVDPAKGTKSPLVDPDRVREVLEVEFGHVLPFRGLPFTDFEFCGDRNILFSIPRQLSRLIADENSRMLDLDSGSWLVDLNVDTYTVMRVSPSEVQRRRRAKPRHVRKGFVAADPGPYEIPSPDGALLLGEREGNLALRAVVDDKQHLLTVDGVKGNAWHIDGGPAGPRWVTGAVWSPDSQRVAVIRKNTRACSLLPLVSWLQTNEQVEWHPYARAGGAMPTTTAAVIDVRSRDVREIQLPGERDQTIAPVGWRHDGAEAYFLTTDRRQKYLRLYAVDALTAECRLVCEETQATFVVGIRRVDRFASELILADDTRLLWYSERDGWRHLYLYGTDGTQLGRITSGAFEVLKVLEVDLETETVYFTAHSEAERPYDVHVCRASLDGSGFRQLTRAPGVHDARFTPTGTHFLDTHSAFDRPTATDLVSVDGEVAMTLATAEVSGFPKLDLGVPELFTVLAADGVTELHGVLYLPPGFDSGKVYPVIECAYGGPHVAMHPAGFMDWFGDMTKEIAIRLAMQGFVVFSVDGRGTPERGKAFQDVVYGRFHQFYVDDHAHVLRQLLERHPFMDAAHIGITGASWGGYNAVRALLLAPELYKVGVAVCPVYGLDDQVAYTIEPYMGLPVDRPEAFKAGSSLDIVDRLQAKLLLIHGTSDVNATFSATLRMCEALVRADKPYDLVVLPEADHVFGNAGKHHYRYMQAALIRYFVEHLALESTP